MLQLIFNSAGDSDGSAGPAPATLGEMREGQEGVLATLDLPDKVARRLMELGFLPGSSIKAVRSAPGGDPKVFRVDGSEIAIRRETAAQMRLRNGHSQPATR